MERFFGVLIEHYNGAFPTWLAPVQAVVIPVADRYLPYAREVGARLTAEGFRVEVDGAPHQLAMRVDDLRRIGDRRHSAGITALDAHLERVMRAGLP
jgi:threonyl-tRNA synthetase